MVRLSKSITDAKPYPFKKIAEMKKDLLEKGGRVIDLGVGDTVLEAPKIAVEALKKAVEDPKFHHYNLYNGYPFYRRSVSEWMKRQHGVKLDPETEITALIGSKEALFRVSAVFIDPGDYAIVPSPAYPAIAPGVRECGGEVFDLPLRQQNNFLPDFDEVPEKIKEKTKFVYINYPNNPTSAVLTKEFCEDLFKLAQKYDWAIVSDMAYSEVYEKERNLSLLEFEGGMDRVIEFHSLSKTFSMTGFRIGFAAGNSEIIRSLVKIKSIRGSSPFGPVQAAGAAILDNADSYLEKMRAFYAVNRSKLKSIFDKKGIEYFNSKSTFYLWAKVPNGFSSMEFCLFMMEKCGTVVTPGSILGSAGEGWFRACFACKVEDLMEFENRFQGLK